MEAAMNVSIVGTGKMANALSTVLLKGGNNVTLVGRTPGKAEALAKELSGNGTVGNISIAKPGTLPGEVVILAVPYGAAQPLVQQYYALLPGLILVDITNPVNYQTMELVTPPGSSGAEELARLAPPTTRVIKAFNTTFAKTLLAGKVAGIQLDVFIAGDDEEAKARVIRLVVDGGLHALDVGPLKRARQLEAVGLFHIALQYSQNTGFMSTIKFLSLTS
jgi:predicted dinucleotide-binding enzyme